MTPDYLLLLVCLLVSFCAAFFRKLFESDYYPKNLYVFIIDVIISGIFGVVIALMSMSLIKEKLIIIGLSGFIGMFGSLGIRKLVEFKLGRKIKIKFDFNDDPHEIDIFSQKDKIDKNKIEDKDELLKKLYKNYKSKK